MAGCHKCCQWQPRSMNWSLLSSRCSSTASSGGCRLCASVRQLRCCFLVANTEHCSWAATLALKVEKQSTLSHVHSMHAGRTPGHGKVSPPCTGQFGSLCLVLHMLACARHMLHCARHLALPGNCHMRCSRALQPLLSAATWELSKERNILQHPSAHLECCASCCSRCAVQLTAAPLLS
jgi:hypothetical protein